MTNATKPALSLGVVAATSLLATAAMAETKYTFYHILWGMSDANVQFHIGSGESYMASHPEVEIKFVGPENYDPAEHAKFLDTVMNANPDGIAMHISSADALLPGLRALKERGIPFVSVTSHPPSPEDAEKLDGLFLSWVGADESLIGDVMGNYVLDNVTPTPTRVAYLMSHLGHAGQEKRASGFFDAMPDGVESDRVVTGDEPLKAKDVIRSYIVANPDVSVIFGGLSPKWTTDILEELGRDDIVVLTSDESPGSIECVVEGLCLASFAQQFPIQAPYAYEILYQFNETTMAPILPTVTGPAIIDASNIDATKTAVLEVLGEDTYYSMSPY